ncbi:MAG: dihydropteroate synthase [Alphaproteobacteria bacterium]|nr:dihydropteroate synthase [Alphaproteobacteria bacterium]
MMRWPSVMGIVNVTPDSFSGDGVLQNGGGEAEAVAQAKQMVVDGAGILDIGGESTRPGATPVSAEEEIRRVVPVIGALAEAFPDVPLAVDTTKAVVAEQALQAGASIINDISGLKADPRMGEVAVRHGATVVLMHNRARPGAVHWDVRAGGAYEAAVYGDVVADVVRDLKTLASDAVASGVAREKIILDPGIGFGKTPEQDRALIANLNKVKSLGYPVLMALSRKSFIGRLLGLSVDERREATAAGVAVSLWLGADIVRVHDVKAMARVAAMTLALRESRTGENPQIPMIS